MVNGFFFKIGLLDEHFARSVKHRLRRFKPYTLDGVDYPLVNFIVKLVEIYVIFGSSLLVVNHPIHVNGILGKHGSQLNIEATATDGKAYLFGLQIYISLLVFLIDIDVRHLGGTQCTLNEELCVGRPVDDVNILIVQLAHNAVHTAATNADARANGVNSVVITLDGYLGTVARHARNLLD